MEKQMKTNAKATANKMSLGDLIDMFYMKPFRFYSVVEDSCKIINMHEISGIKAYSNYYEEDWLMSLDNCACPLKRRN